MKYRTSTVNAVRLNDLEKSILQTHLKNNEYTDIRHYLQHVLINQYYKDAVDRINEIKKSVT